MKRNFFLSIISISLLLLTTCGGGRSDNSSSTGSISFQIEWQRSNSISKEIIAKIMAQVDVCADYGITTIIATVQNSNNQPVASGTWPCAAHEGIIYNVPAGTNMKIILEGTVSGVVRWRGEKTGISCTAGLNTNVGNITVSYIGFTKQFGGTAADYGDGIAIDRDGNIFITGWTASNLDGNTNAGMNDIVLVKYDAAGDKHWARLLGTTNNEFARGVAVDSSGNLYLTGRTYGGLDGNTNAGGNDIFLIKYDSNGNKQWTKQLGSNTNEYCMGIAVDSSGNIYLTGYTQGGLDGNTSVGTSDIFLIKYDSAGNKQWTRQFGTAADDYARGVSVDQSGNIYITGNTSGGLDWNTNAGAEDIFLVKYNSDGVRQ